MIERPGIHDPSRIHNTNNVMTVGLNHWVRFWHRFNTIIVHIIMKVHNNKDKRRDDIKTA
jgi:hypothetical protein